MDTDDDAVAQPLEAPAAFSGHRLDWRDLPRSVRARIAERVGSQVVAEVVATSGFSPGFAGVLELADGDEIFVKAVSPEQNPDSPDLARREVVAVSALPEQVPAPRLLWADDDGDWVLLAFEVVPGRSPELPWRRDQLALVLDAVDRLSRQRPVPGHRLGSLPDDLATSFTGWRAIASLPSHEQARLAARTGGIGEWALAHLDELVVWEERTAEAAAGDALVHGDLRADNVLIDDQDVWLLDWPWAAVGAPWFDLAAMLPSVAMQGGGDAHAIFTDHPLGRQVAPGDLRAVVTGLTGFFAHSSMQPDPPGIPNIRAFQRAQAYAALDWLRRLADGA